MKPPTTMDVRDHHGGFSVEGPVNTFWRGAGDYDTVGTLLDFDEESFYQVNDDCTKARYKIPRYRFPAIVWFDNESGERVGG